MEESFLALIAKLGKVGEVGGGCGWKIGQGKHRTPNLQRRTANPKLSRE